MFQPSIKSKADEDISIFLQLDNHSGTYMCDCGHASGYSIKELTNIDALFLSHMHMDHFIGFDLMMRHQVGSKKKITICGPKGIAKQVSSKLQAYTWNLVEPDAIEYEIREVMSAEVMNIYSLIPPAWELGFQRTIHSNPVYTTADFSVRAVILDHKTDSIAYRFDEKDQTKIDLRGTRYYGGPWVAQLKQAYELQKPDSNIEVDGEIFPAESLFHLLRTVKGHSFGVILDHAANAANHEKIIELFQDCDLVYIESFFKAEDKHLAEVHAHSYTIESAKVMRKAKVKKAVPIHFSRKYSEVEREELREEFEEAFQEFS